MYKNLTNTNNYVFTKDVKSSEYIYTKDINRNSIYYENVSIYTTLIERVKEHIDSEIDNLINFLILKGVIESKCEYEDYIKSLELADRLKDKEENYINEFK